MGAEGQEGWGPQVSRPEMLLGRKSRGLLQVIVFRVTSWALEGSLSYADRKGMVSEEIRGKGDAPRIQTASAARQYHYPPAVLQVFLSKVGTHPYCVTH